MPALASVIRALDSLNQRVGVAVAWLALAMVSVQFAIVILRYVFSIGFIPMQESVWYLHGLLFMLGAGFTLLHDGHVRIDIFYRTASPRRQALVDLIGVTFLLFPVCLLILHFSTSYVLNAWRVFEGSTEAGGIPGIFLLKSVIWAFVFLTLLQGLSLALRAAMTLAGATPPPRPQKHPGVV